MLLNLSDVFTSEGKVLHKSVPLEMTSFDSRLGTDGYYDNLFFQYLMYVMGEGNLLSQGYIFIASLSP